MGKHAYCILAHNEPILFRWLIELLDDPRNDIFVHIDKRTDISPFLQVSCNYSKLVFLQDRIACNWGSLSIVKAELALFEEVVSSGRYDFCHLLSGVDLPIKDQDSIHGFFDRHPGENFIGFQPGHNESEDERTKFYHLRVYRPGGNRWMRSCNLFDRISVKVQRKLGIRVHYPFQLYKGAQWVSLSPDFLEWLIKQKEFFLKCFRFAFIPDERFVQSAFMASPFASTLYLPDGDEYDQCMREIDWERGRPYTWEEGDYELLVQSRRMFARKFSSAHQDIAEMIYKQLKKDG